MEKLKLIVCRGISGSGKSFFAEQKAKELGNCIIITKDDIRASMGVIVGDDRTKVKEGKVVQKRNELIMEALEKGKNIISADTNLNIRARHIENIKSLVFPKYRDFYEFEIKDFTDVDIETCIERCASRPEGREFWSKIIKEQHKLLPSNQFFVEQDASLPKCVISDHDGTICHPSPNRSFYTGIGSEEDTQNEIVCEYLRLMKQAGYTIIKSR